MPIYVATDEICQVTSALPAVDQEQLLESQETARPAQPIKPPEVTVSSSTHGRFGTVFAVVDANHRYSPQSAVLALLLLPERMCIKDGDHLVAEPFSQRAKEVPSRFQWAQSKDIALNHMQPGTPTQNAWVERFNKTFRTGVLDCCIFDSLQDVREMTADWLNRYNQHRPHESLDRIPPVEYRVKKFPNLYF